ncbi:MAG: NADH-quinone oxidoreductase subunit N [Planctomycetota bacterium]
MNEFTAKLATLWPEIIMLVGAVACLTAGLSPSSVVRKATPWVAAGAMVLAWVVTLVSPVDPHPLGFDGMVPFVKCLILGMGLILLLVNIGVPEALVQNIASEKTAFTSAKFEPGNAVRGEFYAFFLLSLTGAMLTAGATDLVWLFLALELTSLPTYVMIATSRDRAAAQESAIKYFFLGAMAAAVFLYGFALIYGATGFTEFGPIAAAVAEQAGEGGEPSMLLILGVALAVLGLCFKVAAVPMHLYAADVYEGAATPVTAFLAVVPKIAGFSALILVLGLVGWGYSGDGGEAGSVGLPEPLAQLLAILAVLTMTIGNVLAIIQTNIKRVLAYSSIAHSGYLLTGLVAGLSATSVAQTENASGSGIAAVLFYLLVYAMATVGSFAVLACIRAKHPDGDREHDTVTYEDVAGLWWKNPVLAGIMLVSMLSLVGMPPLAGFLGKVYLIGGVFTAGYTVLAVIIVINSAISAGYYLRIAMTCFFGEPSHEVNYAKVPTLIIGAGVTTAAAFMLGGYPADEIVKNAHDAVLPGEVVEAQPGVEPPGNEASEAAEGLYAPPDQDPLRDPVETSPAVSIHLPADSAITF